MKNLNLKNIKTWALPTILLALMITAYAFDVHKIVSLSSFHEHKAALQNISTKHSFLTVILFSSLYIGSVALSLPIATLLTLAAGFLFGWIKGTLLVVASATIGASIIFMIAKSSAGQTLRDKAGPLYKKAEENMNDNAVSYLLFLRLVPVFPFFLVNILPALFNIPLRIFFITTFLGILPGSTVYVYVGQELGNIETIKDLISKEMLIAFALLGILALTPSLHKQLNTKSK